MHELFADTLASLTRDPPLEETLELVLTRLSRALGGQCRVAATIIPKGHYYLVSPDREQLRRLALPSPGSEADGRPLAHSPGLHLGMDPSEGIAWAPIAVGDRDFGFLGVWGDRRIEPGQVRSDSLVLLAANLIALAVDRWRLTESVERGRKLLACSSEIEAAIASSRPLDLVLKKIAETVRDVAQAHSVVLYDVQPDGDVRIPPIMAGDFEQPTVLVTRSAARPHRDSTVFKLMTRRIPVYANGLTDWQAAGVLPTDGIPADHFILREGIESSAGIPLTRGMRPAGALFVNYRRKQEFDPDLKRMLEAFADHAAIAIDNARLFREHQETLSRLKVLIELSKQTAADGHVDLRTGLGKIVTACVEAAGSDGGAAFVAVEGRHLKLVHSHRPSALEGRALEPDEGLVSRVFAAGQRDIVPDYRTYEHRIAEVDPSDLRSLAAVPIWWEQEVMGVLTLTATTPERFNSADLDLLEGFAGVAGSVIAAARNRDLTRALVHCSPDAVIAIDARGQVTVFNSAATSLLGYTEATVLGSRVENLYAGAIGEARRIAALLENEPVQNLETWVLAENRGRIPILLSAARIVDSDDRELGSVGIMKDARLGALQAPFRRLIDALGELGGASTQRELVTLALNDALGLLGGRTAQLAVLSTAAPSAHLLAEVDGGRTRSEPLTAGEVDGLRSLAQRVGPAYIYEPKNLPSALDGESTAAALLQVEYEDRLAAILRIESPLGGAFDHLSDLLPVYRVQLSNCWSRVTLGEERQAAQARLMASANAIKVADQSLRFGHQVKNHLHLAALTLIGLEKQLDEAGLSQDAAHWLRSQTTAVRGKLAEIRELVSQLRDAGERRPSEEWVCAWELVDKVVGQLRGEFEQKGVILEAEPSSGPSAAHGAENGTVFVDPREFRNVLMNLAFNALDACQPGDRVTFASRAGDAGIEVSVADTGHGLTASDLEHVLEPFVTSKQSGSGIGLYVVRLFAESHGGRVQASSPGPGRGARFTLYLPKRVQPSAGSGQP